MGQYFKAVNLDKREYVCPWCVGGLAKLWEWATNPWGAIFTMLLRKSSSTGGGDYYAGCTQEIHLSEDDTGASLLSVIRAGVAREGQPVSPPLDTTVGRWAGDRVALVGDYDDSRLWDELPSYRNISAEVVRDWNAFIDIPEMKLKHDGTCRCTESS